MKKNLLVFILVFSFQQTIFSQKQEFYVGKYAGMEAFKNQTYQLKESIKDTLDFNKDHILDFVINIKYSKVLRKTSVSILPLGKNEITFDTLNKNDIFKMVGSVKKRTPLHDVSNWTNEECYFLIKKERKVLSWCEYNEAEYFANNIYYNDRSHHGWLLVSINDKELIIIDATCRPTSLIKYELQSN